MTWSGQASTTCGHLPICLSGQFLENLNPRYVTAARVYTTTFMFVKRGCVSSGENLLVIPTPRRVLYHARRILQWMCCCLGMVSSWVVSWPISRTMFLWHDILVFWFWFAGDQGSAMAETLVQSNSFFSWCRLSITVSKRMIITLHLMIHERSVTESMSGSSW